MAIDRNELKKKAMEAAGAEEIMEIMKAAGEEITAEEAAQLFEKVQARKTERELSLDELEAVSGGADRDWLEVGCAATVEPGSWCGSNDWCAIVDVTYVNSPNRVCPYCGGYSIFIGRVEFRKPGVAHEKKYWCSSCNRIEYVVENPTI